MVLEKTFESPLVSTEIKPVNCKLNQPWIFIRRTDAEAEALILWPPDVKSQFIGKDPNAGKDWRQKEKGVTEDEMVRYHHWLNGHEFEQTLQDSGGQRSLECCSPWGHTSQMQLSNSTMEEIVKEPGKAGRSSDCSVSLTPVKEKVKWSWVKASQLPCSLRKVSRTSGESLSQSWLGRYEFTAQMQWRNSECRYWGP